MNRYELPFPCIRSTAWIAVAFACAGVLVGAQPAVANIPDVTERNLATGHLASVVRPAARVPQANTGIRSLQINCVSGTSPFVSSREDELAVWCASKDRTGRYIRNGIWELWKSGTKTASGEYRAGVKEGVWRFFSHPGGEKSSEGNYRSGLLDGVWTSWNATGEIDTMDEYSLGQLKTHRTFEPLQATASIEMHMSSWDNRSSNNRESDSLSRPESLMIVESAGRTSSMTVNVTTAQSGS